MKPFRGKPQQLTLFKAPKPTDQHRWPEGYSPERRQAVAERVTVLHAGSAREGMSNRYSNDTGAGEWYDPKPSVGQKNAIADIARSTVPTEHLQNPYTGQRLQVQARTDMLGGVYYGGQGKIGVGPDANAHTLLHEIGHAASDLTNNPHATRNKNIKAQLPSEVRNVVANMGREEAFADNYAREHVGARRGEQPDRTRASVYERGPKIWEQGYKMPAPEAHIAFRTYMNARQFHEAPPARGAEPAQMPHGRKPYAPGKYWQPEFEQ